MRRELNRSPFVVGGFVDLGLWRILLLDSTIPGSASGRLSAASLAALEAALASAPNRHCLVCLHHHPVDMESRWLDRVGLENADEFLQIIDRHRNVKAIVWGHVHQSYEGLRKGVRLLATPSTCAQFLPHADDFAVGPATAGLSHARAATGWIAFDGGCVGRKTCCPAYRAQSPRLPDGPRREPRVGHPRRAQHGLSRRLRSPPQGE